MASKKELTIEELKVLYENALKESKKLGEMLKKREKDEADRKAAQLALEKEKRGKAIEEAYDSYISLVKAYVKDYGSYKSTYNPEDYEWLPRSFWNTFF